MRQGTSSGITGFNFFVGYLFLEIHPSLRVVFFPSEAPLK